jgi:hypothetical protein
MPAPRLDAASLTQLLIWTSCLVFGAGGVYAQVTGAREATEDLKIEVRHHTSERGHPVGLERMETLMVEQRALRGDVAAQGKTLAAICQATGADCR